MKPSVAERIKKRLEEFTRDLENGEPITEKYTCRRLNVGLKPAAFDPKTVKQTRETLHASQAVFALFLGVSVKAVQTWEQGAGKPSKIACRFMDEIRRNPTYWIGRLRELVAAQ